MKIQGAQPHKAQSKAPADETSSFMGKLSSLGIESSKVNSFTSNKQSPKVDLDHLGLRKESSDISKKEASISADTKKVLTLEEIESQMLAKMRSKQLEIAHNLLKQEEQARMEELKYSFEKYRGLMTQGDKDHVLKVQISQIFTDDSSSESFYSHMYEILRNTSGGHSGKTRAEKEGYGLNENRVHLQLQRMINDARRRKPKSNTVVLNGALGKITAKTSRNPKQVIQIEKEKDIIEKAALKQGSEKKEMNSFTPETDKRKTLQLVEAVYDSVLIMEQIIRDRQIIEVEYEREQTWQMRYNSSKEFVWSKLELEQPNYPQGSAPFHRQSDVGTCDYSGGKFRKPGCMSVGGAELNEQQREHRSVYDLCDARDSGVYIGDNIGNSEWTVSFVNG
ncbi:DNA topoisomerase 2-associated protein pat1 [Smittium mucronatum]|uniref:DNA topoisomerase 2-associated protein pat1 n=1 Tax=Smittium mucronatum TaxID=133383 RepID=A0A1R0GMD9_9FUNG|nr:DNA topoisomerase 2-associated protein pat1 [Smittium mucronatum]